METFINNLYDDDGENVVKEILGCENCNTDYVKEWLKRMKCRK